MKYTVICLDFDEVYGVEEDTSSIGVAPNFYIVPEDKVESINQMCYQAVSEYHNSDGDLTVSDILEVKMISAGIKFQFLGALELLSFGERSNTYLNNKLTTITL